MNYKNLIHVLLCCSLLLVAVSITPINAEPKPSDAVVYKFPATPFDGKPAPPFSLTRFGDNKVVTLDSLKGKRIVLNFWASWCGPCRDEMPLLNQLHKNYADQNVVVLGVNYQQSEKAIRRYLEIQPFAFPTLIDEKGSLATAYKLTGLPATFFIDSQGIVLGGVIGGLHAEWLPVWMDRLTKR